MNDQQFAAATDSFQRTLLLSPQFPKAFQLLGTGLSSWVAARKQPASSRMAIGSRRNGATTFRARRWASSSWSWANRRPRQKSRGDAAGNGSGFRCASPRCLSGSAARQLPKPPMADDIGREIYAKVCADCWEQWLRKDSIKVINEGHLDLSTEQGQMAYDAVMREVLGLV